MLERVALLGVSFVVSAWFVRYLGPTEYGRYSYAVSFAALFSSFAALGMDSVIVRDLARDADDEGEILGTSLALRVGAGTIAWLAMLVAVLSIRRDPYTRTMIAVAGANSLFIGAGVFELWFQARIAARSLVVTRLAIALLFHASRCVLIGLRSTPLVFAALVTLTGAMTALAVYLIFARARPSVRLRWSTVRARVLLRDCWPMIFVAIGIALYLKVDQVMLSALSGDRENGIYAPAATLSELWYFIPVAISSSAFPALVRTLDTMSAAESEARLQSFYDAMAATAYAIAVPVTILAGPVVALLYGPDFARTAEVLRVHVISLVFTTVGIARGRYLIAQNLIGFTLVSTLLGAAVNIALNWLLLPSFGAMGAAWSTLLSYAVANYLSGFLWPRMWHQTAMITRALLLPVRALCQLVARSRRMSLGA